MKRVRCPKCDTYITFDETQYEAGQSLVFQCNECGKQFGIRIGVSKLRETQKRENEINNGQFSNLDTECGSIVVIENVFHFKQICNRFDDISRRIKNIQVTSEMA